MVQTSWWTFRGMCRTEKLDWKALGAGGRSCAYLKLKILDTNLISSSPLNPLNKSVKVGGKGGGDTHTQDNSNVPKTVQTVHLNLNSI